MESHAVGTAIACGTVLDVARFVIVKDHANCKECAQNIKE